MIYYGLIEFICSIEEIRDKIIYCEAHGDNARAYLTNGDYWHLTCCLGRIEGLLNNDDFFRCDKSFLVNHCFITGVNFETNLLILYYKTKTSESYLKIPASYRALKKIRVYLSSKGYIIL
jgi:DNA-binding LytR/AlgR family response regulator